MAGLILKRPSPFAYPGSAAGIDASHPAAAGLLISTVARSGNHINLLNGAAGSIAGTPSRKLDGNLGDAVNFPGATDRINFASFPTTVFQTGTTAAIFRLNAVATLPVDICGDSNGSNVGFSIGLDQTVPAFTVRFNAFIIAGALDSYAANVPYFVAASRNASNNVSIVVRRLDNGQVRSAELFAASGGAAGIGTYVVGGRDNTSGRNLNGAVACSMRSTAALSQAQLQAWAQDPWSFWYPQKLDVWQMLKVAAGGTTFPQTVSVSCAASVSVAKQVGKSVAVACSGTVSVIKSAAKRIAVTCSGTVAALKSVGKRVAVACSGTVAVQATRAFLITVSVNCAASVSVTKQVAKRVVVACSGTVAPLKSIAKRITVACSTSTTVAAIRVFLVTITVGCATTVGAVRKSVGKVVAVSATASVTSTKAVAKRIAVACSGTVSATKQIGKRIAVTCSSLVSTVAQFLGLSSQLRGITVTTSVSSVQTAITTAAVDVEITG